MSEELVAAPEAPPHNVEQDIRVLEALLFATPTPVSAKDLYERMPEGSDVGGALMELQKRYEGRGVNLTEMEGLWAFRTAADVGSALEISKDVERKLSRAAMETLAIVAYHQPLTRAEIENIRGVATNLQFVENVINHPQFVAGQVITRFIDETPELFKFARRRDRAAQRRAPPAELLGVTREQEQLGPGARHPRQCRQCGPATVDVVDRGRDRQGEQRRIDLGRPPGLGDRDDPLYQADRIGGGHPQHGLGGIPGQLVIAGVVRAAVGTQREEPVHARPVVDGEGVAAGGIGHLLGCGGLRLPRPAQVDRLQDVHRGYSSRPCRSRWMLVRATGV